MTDWFIIGGMLVAVACLGYFLYRNGWLVVNTKTALFYKGSFVSGKGEKRVHAKFSLCSGTVRRVIRLQRQTPYIFVFFSAIARGSVEIEIWNGKTEVLAVLNDNSPEAVIQAESTGRCWITVKFTKADGEYTLSWRPLPH